ncbi:MAG: hypothetical protein IPF98_12115 [Gemmatimonadetes bacterium]|nr:hypothetical protein [Gemmatimonadota bacterium]
MIALFLVAQLAGADSIYSSSGVRAHVEQASRVNRRVPVTMSGYRAQAESEIAIVARRGEGHEGAVSIEQTQNEVRWTRDGNFEQRVVGYRAQAIGLQFSSLSFFRQAWTVPSLYGNRLTLLFGQDTSRQRPSRRRIDQRLVAVHPLAEDRERVYRYTGGDTQVTLRVDGREIPIVRIIAEPREDAPDSTVAFRGELDLDASRDVLVRMRGYFVRKAPAPSLLARLLTVGGFEAVAFVELENGEIDGRYWLPTYQRFEAQAALTGATDSRSIFRVVTRFRDHEVQLADTTLLADVDSLMSRPYPLSFAPAESLSTVSGWRRALGAATSDVHSDDFNDIAPDVWRPTGRPRLEWRTQRLMDLVHVNRVEGVYTGYGAELRLRDAAPGVTLRANAGWAWSEMTARGRASAEWRRGASTYLVRAGRSLDLTNDFRSIFDSGSTVGPIFGADNYDYVDRRLAALGIWRQIGAGRSAILRVESGPARDRTVMRRLSRGLVRGDSGFRENRGVREGDYWRHWASLEWHPDVSADFVRPGVGALVNAEMAHGDLRYARLEGRVMARHSAGPVTLAARGDVGTLLGASPPPQQLFELGRNQNLPGYGYKEFAGTDAAIVRGLVMYSLGVLRAPIRVRRWFLPAVSPALAIGAQSGWTQVRGNGGRAAMLELGLLPTPPQLDGIQGVDVTPQSVSRETSGVRTSVTVGFRVFGGAVGVGMARAVDRRTGWRLLVDFSPGV